MLAQLEYCAIEGLYGAVGAREHDAAFHGYEDEGRESVDVGGPRHGGFHFEEAFANGFDPSLEVAGDECVGGSVFGIDLEGEAADGTAVTAFRGEDALAVSSKDGEDAFERFAGRSECGIDDHRAKKLAVLLKYGAKQGFLTVEEVIEAARIDLGVSEQFGHAGTGEAAFPEKKAGGIDQAIAG